MCLVTIPQLALLVARPFYRKSLVSFTRLLSRVYPAFEMISKLTSTRKDQTIKECRDACRIEGGAPVPAVVLLS